MFAVVISKPIRETITIPDVCKFIIPVTLNIFDDDVYDKIVTSLTKQNIEYKIYGYVPPGPTPVPPNPYYPIDSDCILYHAYWDGTAVDHSIYGNNGTKVGTHTSFEASGITISVAPGGVEGPEEGVHIPYSSSLNFTDQCSFDFWGSLPTLDYGPIISQGDLGVPNAVFKFYIQNLVLFGYGIGVPYGDTYVLPEDISWFSFDTFFHIVYTFDYSGENIIKCYVNAVEKALIGPPNPGPLFPDPVRPPSPLYNGGDTIHDPVIVGSERATPIFWAASQTIREIRIWKKVLSQTEITNIFNATKRGYGL